MEIPLIQYCVMKNAIECFKYLLVNGFDDPNKTMKDQNPYPQDEAISYFMVTTGGDNGSDGAGQCESGVQRRFQTDGVRPCLRLDVPARPLYDIPCDRRAG